MTTLTIFLAGFSLATFAWGIFYALIMLHRPRYTAPTRRRNPNSGGLTCATPLK
jgi:hypothetical protein